MIRLLRRPLAVLAAFILSLLLLPLAQAVESMPVYPRLDGGNRKAPSAPQFVYKESFADVLASTWSGEWERLQLGTGMANSQSAGNGVITSGTTANSETVLRLRQSFAGAVSVRGKVTLSQRIANNNFFVELVDLIGDGLDCTINSAISITVRLPAGYPLMSSADVGKSFTVGVISGAAGIPGRYAIASVDTTGRLVNLTVAGWPVSGSCTLSAWGLNSYRMLYTSTTATNVAFDSYRMGWGSGDSTLTINTTASGHLFNLVAEDVSASYLDTTTNSLSWTQRGQRTDDLPDNGTPMVLQIRALNGTSNPATTTTFTLGFLTVERFDAQQVMVTGQKALGGAQGIPAVTIASNSATNQSTNVAQINGVTPLMGNGTTGTGSLRVTLASDTTSNTNPLLVNQSQVNGVAMLTGNGVTGTGSVRVTLASDTTANSNPFLVVGSAAHSAGSVGSPVRVGGRVQTAADTTLAAGDASDLWLTTGGAQVVKQWAIPEMDWQYAAAASGIVNTTTAVTIKTAAAAGIRNYITSIQVMAEAVGTATELAIRDGAAGTVIWRTKIGTAGIPSGQTYTFSSPLKGTAATLLEVVTLSATVTGAVYVNCQGYTAP